MRIKDHSLPLFGEDPPTEPPLESHRRGTVTEEARAKKKAAKGKTIRVELLAMIRAAFDGLTPAELFDLYVRKHATRPKDFAYIKGLTQPGMSMLYRNGYVKPRKDGGKVIRRAESIVYYATDKGGDGSVCPYRTHVQARAAGIITYEEGRDDK